MYASLLFWLALSLPGYVVVRRVWKEDLKSGLLGTLGLSYLAVFGLLSPVSILCYVLHAPLWVFSATCVAAVVAALVDITRQGWWGEVGKLVAGGASIELLIVAADMVMGSRVGALVEGDAVLHLTRIRFLLDHGFNNNDPFVAGSYFFPIYHTNLQHALYAACSQLTGIHHVRVWFASLPWAKLLIAAGSYYMVWSVFDRRWVAWVAAVFTVGRWGPVDFVVYPNKLAPLWVVALMIGFAVRACRTPCGWQSPLKLGVGSLVLGQLHSLYGAFAGIMLGPILGCVGLARMIGRRPDRWRVAACTAALTAALPFLLVSKFNIPHRAGSSTAAAAGRNSQAATRATDKSRTAMAPRPGWGTPDWRSACLGVGIVCALAGSRRKEAAVLLGVAGTVVLIFHVPFLCAAALMILQEKWILGRLGFVLYLGFVGLGPAPLAFLVERKVRFWWARGVIGVAVLFLGVAFVRHKEPTTWRAYWSHAVAPRLNPPGSTRQAYERAGYLEMTRQVIAFCQKHIPRGATVLLNEWQGMVLTMVHDCHIVAPRNGGNGIPDWGRRRRDLKIMLAANTPWHTRRLLLRKYGIEYFFPAGSPTGWTKGHLKDYRTEPGFRLYVLDTDDERISP